MSVAQVVENGGGTGTDARRRDDAPPGAAAVPALDRRVQVALWLVLGVFALQGVFGHALWGGNDSREGGMIWDMYRHGTYVTPTINGQPFLEKPPLLHWTALLFCRLAAGVSEGLLRLPAALYGLGTLLLIYLLVSGPWAPDEPPGASRGRQLAAWAAVFSCGTAAEFYEYSRIVLTDIVLTFMVTLALFVFWRIWQRPTIRRWLMFLVVAAAAFYAKGLIGPALIWSAVGVFLLWRRRLRLLAGLAAAYVPVLLALVRPWVAALYASEGAAAVRFAFWDNQVGRFFRFANMALPHDPFFINKEPLYYYLTHLPVYLAPWTLLLVPALVAWWRRSSPFRAPFHVFVTTLVTGMLILLHLSTSKVVNYALPLFPLLFVMLGVWIAEVAQRGRPGVLERWAGHLAAWGLVSILGLVPVVFVVGTFVRPGLFRSDGRVATIAGVVLAGFLLALVVTTAVVVYRFVRSSARPVALSLAPAVFALVAMGALQLVRPAIDRNRSYRPFATVAAEEVTLGRDVALADAQQSDIGPFTFYLDRRLPILTSPTDIVAYLKASRPRAMIAPAGRVAAVEAALAAVPHAQLQAGAPGTVSRSFVMLVNRPEEEEALVRAGEGKPPSRTPGGGASR